MIRNTNVIPDMTHPLCWFWEQPDKENILIDDFNAIMSKTDFDKLENYTASIPSGVYPGKMWRDDDWLCWFGAEEKGKCPGFTRKIIIV